MMTEPVDQRTGKGMMRAAGVPPTKKKRLACRLASFSTPILFTIMSILKLMRMSMSTGFLYSCSIHIMRIEPLYYSYH